MPVSHRPARRPSSAGRPLGVAAVLAVLALVVLATLGVLPGPDPTAATAAAPGTTSTAAASPAKGSSSDDAEPGSGSKGSSSDDAKPASGSGSKSPSTTTTSTSSTAPPVAEVPCPTSKSAATPAGPTSSCADTVPKSDPTGTRCHRKTVDVLARAGDTRKLVVQASLTLRWCSEGPSRLLRTTAQFSGTAGNGLSIAVARQPRIRRPRRGVAVGDVRFRVTGKPRADVYASTTPGAVLRSRRRVRAGRKVDERLTLQLSVRAGGRATARCTGRIVACRVTPGDR